MVRNILFAFMLLHTFSAFSQTHQKSALYFNNGKLRADSTLKISKDQFDAWHHAEQNITAGISSNLTYPEIASRNGLEGRIIVAFDCTANEIKNVRTLNVISGPLDAEAILAVQRSGGKILETFENLKRNRKLKSEGTYFIPIDFNLLYFEKEMKNKGAIPVQVLAPPITGEGQPCFIIPEK